MRKIIILLALLVGYFINTRIGKHENPSGIQPQITISDLKNSSLYTDSLVELRNLRVIETQSLLNYSRSKLSDKTGQEIILLSTRPFRANENVDIIEGRYTVICSVNKMRCEVFISDDMNPLTDLMKVLKQSLLF